MAGPVASVVVSELAESDRQWLESYVRTISIRVEGRDFWVLSPQSLGADTSDARPFIWEDRGRWDAGEPEAFRREFGYEPGAEIVVSAMCNDVEDHRIL